MREKITTGWFCRMIHSDLGQTVRLKKARSPVPALGEAPSIGAIHMKIRKGAAVLLALASSIAPAASSNAGGPVPAPTELYEVISGTDDRLADERRVRANGGHVISSSTEATLVRLTDRTKSRIESTIDGYIRDPVPLDVRPESFPNRQRLPEFGPTTGDQVALLNADEWHADGFDGDGISIGVIDFFDVDIYWDEAEHGPTPVAGVDARCFELGGDCTDEFFDGENLGGENHGVAIVEIIRDMAPEADIYLGQATTINDYFELIDWFASKGVTVINRSVGSRYDGPGDGRGELDAVAAHAVSKGILWVNSGGNNAKNEYYRHQVRLSGNRVAFGASGSDTFLEFSKCISLGGVRWANDWDKPAGQRSDYDVFVWRSPIGDPGGGTIIASSTDKQQFGAPPIELIFGSLCNTVGTKLYLEVRWNGGDVSGDILEILDYADGMAEYTQQAFSASTSVVDSKLAGVIGVGAIDPAPSGTIADYSSQGPTNDGRIAPAISAPAGFTTTQFGFFAGTSASAAVVSSSAALMQSAGLADDPTSLGNLLRNTTIDRGDPGPDNKYGYGEFRLPDPPSGLPIDQTPSKFVGIDTPTRILDTRTNTPVGPPELIGNPWPGKILELPVSGANGLPPSGITAVAVNIVSVTPDRPSFVQAFPTSRATLGDYSSLNNDKAGRVRSNFAIIPLGDDGKISIYSTASNHIVVDLLGTFQTTAGEVSAGRFVELEQADRLLDTRAHPPLEKLATGTIRAVRFPIGVDPATIDALVVTVTVTQASDPGWVQAYPIDQPDAIGETSTVNIFPGETVANASIVAVGGDQMAVTAFFANNGSGHVIVDAIGFITSDATPPATEGRYVGVRPNRAFDSREIGSGLLDGEVVVIDGSDAAGVTIPSSASGVVWNVAIVSADRPGFARAWASGAPEPATSSLNWGARGETRATAVLSAVNNGEAQFRIEDGSANLSNPVGHLIADVFGYFT
jgi:hypothetical protein